MYNSGARASEVAQLTVGDLRLDGAREKSQSFQSFVQLHGKGNKIRFCPIWASTAAALKPLIKGREDTERVFQSRTGPADDEVRSPRYRHTLRSTDFSPLR
jgi:integrase